MKFRLLVSEAWRSLGANISTTFAAMTTVLIGMFLLGLLIALGTWTLSWSDHVKSELEVKVDFNTSLTRAGQATAAEEDAVHNELLRNPLVKKIVFVSRQQALTQMKRSDPALANSIPYNPLPDEFQVTPKSADDIAQLYASLTHPLAPGVDKVIDGKVYSNRILHFAHAIEIVFSVAIVILLTSAALLIANTIRLSIFARRREIEVMKLVGATNWFVRGPFMLEGLLCGLGGAVLAIILLSIGKIVALPAILHNALSTDPGVHALSFPVNALILLLIGLVLGAIGSGITVRRFLQV
jgi:cell division transport system permease protein